MKKTEVSIVIPCLNEARTIKRVVRDSIKFSKKYFGNKFEVIVADNGSVDGSLKIVKALSKVKLINVPVKGYGAALHWGILNSKSKFIIFADADMSYPFSNLIEFKKTLSKNPDLVLGSRIKGKIENNAMPFLHRYLGTPVLTFLINIIYGIKTSDCNSGMRMVKKSFYKKLNMRNSGMEWASELLCKSSIKRAKYLEVPILFKKDKRGREPHLSSWSDGWRHLKAIFLIKPNTLLFFLALFVFMSIYFYKVNFALSFLFSNFTVVFALSLMTLNLLQSLIENNVNKFSKYLLKFALVPTTLLTTFLVGIISIVIPDERLGTKLFLVSIMGILFMWIFLIETIKTHLANRLPDI